MSAAAANIILASTSAIRMQVLKAAGVPFGLSQVQRDRHGDRDADRDVDEQHPPPGQVLGKHPAEQQAEGRAGAGDRGEHRERPGSGGAFFELGGDQRQCGR